jgi:hypothetical protein
MLATVRPRPMRATARCMAVVDLPLPPLALPTTMIWAFSDSPMPDFSNWAGAPKPLLMNDAFGAEGMEDEGEGDVVNYVFQGVARTPLNDDVADVAALGDDA